MTPALELRPYQRDAADRIRMFCLFPPLDPIGTLVLPPAAGKTAAVNAVLAELIESGRRILWLAPSWAVLNQSARDLRGLLSARYSIGCPKGARGGKLYGLSPNTGADAVFCTIQYFVGESQAARLAREGRYDVLVFDEAHHGYGGCAWRSLISWRRDQPFPLPLIEVTATPREEQLERAIFTLTQREALLADAVARPQVFEVDTGIAWNPTTEQRDYSQGSLSCLARNKRFLETVVDTWKQERCLWGRTLVFAVDTRHADEIRERIYRAGGSAAVLHSGVPAPERDGILSKFRDGRLEVLVTVMMAREGINVPDLNSVFITRPTMIPSLYIQMTGRGARLAPGKSSYNVVDFMLATQANQKQLRGIQSFEGATLRRMQGYSSCQRPPRRHGYEPAEIEIYRGDDRIDGLEFAPRQTFGIEFEVYAPQRTSVCEISNNMLADLRRHHAHEGVIVADRILGTDHSAWNVKTDPSCGIEVTSRILRGSEGFEEVLRVGDTLRRSAESYGLRVNYKCGTHVHLGWEGQEQFVPDLLRLVIAYEPALFSLVSPSRFENEFCDPMRELCNDVECWREWAERYRTFNLLPLVDPGMRTLEIRLHNGTLEGPKILTWISLMMRIMDAARRGVSPAVHARGQTPRLPLSAGKAGDVQELARCVGAGAGLVDRLTARRRQVLEDSWFWHGNYRRQAMQVLARDRRLERERRTRDQLVRGQREALQTGPRLVAV